MTFHASKTNRTFGDTSLEEFRLWLVYNARKPQKRNVVSAPKFPKNGSTDYQSRYHTSRYVKLARLRLRKKCSDSLAILKKARRMRQWM